MPDYRRRVGANYRSCRRSRGFDRGFMARRTSANRPSLASAFQPNLPPDFDPLQTLARSLMLYE
jgi:hypothetical protein